MKFLQGLFQLILVAGIAYAAWWGVQRILATEPKAQREGASRKTAMLVELTNVEAGTFKPEIDVLGRVRPAREIQLRAQVSGLVTGRAGSFTPGDLVGAGDVLVELDEADFKIDVRQRKSEWDQAESELLVELGRQEVAKRDFEMLKEEGATRIDEAQKRLALREPQVEAAKARVEAAKAAWEQAKLDLARTKVPAPFDAQVLTRETDLGSRVSPGDDLGRLVCVDSYWVIASVPLKSLRFIDLGTNGGAGANVRVRDAAAWPEGTYRTGTVKRLIGTLDRTTRLAQVMIQVGDPLALLPENKGKPPLILDAILEVRIEAKPLENVIRLDRSFLRMGDTVWTMEADNSLKIRKVDVAFRNATHAFIREGLDENAQVVTTNLATVVPGAPLRTSETPPEPPEDGK